MLKFFAKCFEAVCCIGAIINLALFGVVGGYLGRFLYWSYDFTDSEVLSIVILAVTGVCVGFFVDVFIYGFIAQVTEIRANTEKLLESKKD